MMTPNPYSTAVVNRVPILLAAIGAGLASAYWAALTLLMAFGVASGSVSSGRLVLPFVLVALYAWRGFQIYQGDPAAARRILWLHGFGCIAAIIQMATLSGFIVVLQGIKILIHVFGGVTAWLASRELSQGMRG